MGLRRLGIMDGERISLRLEPEDLALIDDFVDQHPEFSNRSHLARIALRAFIESDGGSAPKSDGNRVTVQLPARLRSIIEGQVEEGWFVSIDSAIEQALHTKFLTPVQKDDINARSYEKDRKVLERM
jgi:Arc/MetJ-type ribon-helix-helix transcriptional regulator